MKTALSIIFIILVYLYVSGIEVKTNPFRVKLIDWYTPLIIFAIILLVITAMSLSERKGKIKGYNEAYDDIRKVMDEGGMQLKDSESFKVK